MASFVEIDGRRFEFSHATLELYHCGSSEADWNLCRAWFTATTSHQGVLGVNLVSAFEFDWDRELDPPDATYNEPRSARLEISAQVRGMHRGDLPETR